MIFLLNRERTKSCSSLICVNWQALSAPGKGTGNDLWLQEITFPLIMISISLDFLQINFIFSHVDGDGKFRRHNFLLDSPQYWYLTVLIKAFCFLGQRIKMICTHAKFTGLNYFIIINWQVLLVPITICYEILSSPKCKQEKLPGADLDLPPLLCKLNHAA